jgi:hypothetical protein
MVVLPKADQSLNAELIRILNDNKDQRWLAISRLRSVYFRLKRSLK